ncbi:MAG: hypothetical protein EBU74_09820, partial [Betaproteobacteria bacterium]|nr:hypothetical protein [Betaproteobacteria bacterium]
LRLEQDHIHDLTRDQATVHFDKVSVGPDSIISRNAMGLLTEVWPAFLILVAADLCGASEWLLQTTVEYAKERIQFDHPIGFFQAVKHPLVDAMVNIDRARSLLYHAAAEIDAGSPEAETAARMAKSAASDAAAFVSNRAVQLHGGIGFTWEHSIHRGEGKAARPASSAMAAMPAIEMSAPPASSAKASPVHPSATISDHNALSHGALLPSS